MILPLILKIKIKQHEKKGFCLWIPLFLLWPFVFIFLLLLLPFLLIAVVIYFLFSGKYFPIATFSWRFYELFCAMRGLVVAVNSKEQDVEIVIN